jgi:hypothetical protein
MQKRIIRQTAFLLSLIVLFSLCLVDAGAQSRRRRRSRRVKRPAAVRPVVTNPAIAPAGAEQAPGSDTERIISTDEPSTGDEAIPETAPKKTAKPATDSDVQQTINRLSNQVDRLNEKLTQMQQNDRTVIDMERLTRAEQRAESLRSQQVDVESKLADLEAKLEQTEYQLRPENIQQASGYGTVHPEEARDARRRQLEGERSRLQAQIKILETSKDRLETALTTADAEVDSLRRKIELQQAQQDPSGVKNPEPDRRPKPE